jgi:hypothetical protein
MLCEKGVKIKLKLSKPKSRSPLVQMDLCAPDPMVSDHRRIAGLIVFHVAADSAGHGGSQSIQSFVLLLISNR